VTLKTKHFKRSFNFKIDQMFEDHHHTRATQNTTKLRRNKLQ